MLLENARGTEGVISLCRRGQRASAIGAGEARRVPEPAQLGDRLQFVFEENAGRIAARSRSMIRVSTGETVSREIPARCRARLLAHDTSGRRMTPESPD